jgi:hypothetical protein
MSITNKDKEVIKNLATFVRAINPEIPTCTLVRKAVDILPIITEDHEVRNNITFGEMCDLARDIETFDESFKRLLKDELGGKYLLLESDGSAYTGAGLSKNKVTDKYGVFTYKLNLNTESLKIVFLEENKELPYISTLYSNIVSKIRTQMGYEKAAG